MKNNIQNISGADSLSKIAQLNPVTFHYNWQNQNDPLIAGFVAQDFENIFPELVSTDSVTGYKSLSYAPLMPYAIKAIQEMNLNLDAVAGTITPLPGSPSESFVNAFLNNIYNKIGTWLADAGNGIGNIFTKEIDTKSLCVSDDTGAKTCITKSQLDALLAGAAGSVVNNTGQTPSPSGKAGDGVGIGTTDAQAAADAATKAAADKIAADAKAAADAAAQAEIDAKAAADLEAQKIAEEKAATDAAIAAAQAQAEADAKAAADVAAQAVVTP